MRRSWHAVFLALTLAVGVVAPVAALGTAATDGAPAAIGEPAPLQTGDVSADSVFLQVRLAGDGDATWHVEYRVRLDDENRTAAFESLQEDVRTNGSRYSEQFAGRMRRTAATAENATGREMAVRNVSVTATTQELGRSYGVVTYRFEWTGFAAVDGDRLRVGDAIAGFFVDEGTRLEVVWPAGYEATTVRPPPDDRTETSVAWTGPTDFGADAPRVILASAGGGLPVSPALAGGVVVLVAAAGAGALWWRRRDDDARAAAATGGSGDGGDGGDGGPSAAATTAAPAPGGDEGGEGEDDAPEEPPLELLSPEERVLRIVSENGGRVKQQQVVSELDWSAARTSQVVGSLRDDGRVETFRLGRENVIRLPDAEGPENAMGLDDADAEGDADGTETGRERENRGARE